MKSLFRIIRRYSLTVGLIVLVILASNACLLAGIVYTAGKENLEKISKMTLDLMEQIGEELQKGEGNYSLSEKGQKMLEESEFLWAMALDEKGEAVWQWQLPGSMPRKYSIQDVAVFSRWYLEDYPVKELVKGELLLVFGCNPEVLSRHSLFLSVNILRHASFYVKMALILNILVILVLILGLGYRFYHSMKPIAQGIEDLAAQQPVHLKEKGMAGDLAGKLNETSELLLSQSRALDRRDLARTEWIAGVSHDIRTPLSLIVGHSDRLSRDCSLNGENRMLAKSIRRQSLVIRQLIDDLNLTSKLAYQAQPLKKRRCHLASLLRSCVSDIYNEGLEGGTEEEYEFEILMEERMEKIQAEADEGLLMRALRNLLGNSIRHNPQGCRVIVSLTEEKGLLCCLVQDTGPGIPEEVVQNMADPDSRVHIMGLRLSEQIARAHGGRLEFEKRPGGGYDAKLCIRGLAP